MPSSSSKGKPTNQELHDKITEEVKQQTNKDGAFHSAAELFLEAKAPLGTCSFPRFSYKMNPLIAPSDRQRRGSDGSLEVQQDSQGIRKAGRVSQRATTRGTRL
jgi:hypothetical protein